MSRKVFHPNLADRNHFQYQSHRSIPFLLFLGFHLKILLYLNPPCPQEERHLGVFAFFVKACPAIKKGPDGALFLAEILTTRFAGRRFSSDGDDSTNPSDEGGRAPRRAEEPFRWTWTIADLQLLSPKHRRRRLPGSLLGKM